MNKSEFRKNAKNKIDRLFVKIEDLETKKNQVSEDALEKYEETIRNLKYKRARLQQNYHALEIVAEEQWVETKKEFVNATESINEGVKELVALI